MTKLILSVLPEILSICRMDAHDALPAWALAQPFFAITRTAEELSIVCSTQFVPPAMQQSGGWRAMKVQGPLDFSLTGILAGLSQALARAQVGIFAISTYDTDYILVQSTDLDRAVEALKNEGYAFV